MNERVVGWHVVAAIVWTFRIAMMSRGDDVLTLGIMVLLDATLAGIHVVAVRAVARVNPGFGAASSPTRLVFLPMWLAMFFFVRDVVLLVRGS